ncbi:hypothetical protein CBS101457_005923 [Exobasidium rhododendri]|nr:hypothetical protein CBS101457_005923 [Exobasidium rhododendri]
MLKTALGGSSRQCSLNVASASVISRASTSSRLSSTGCSTCNAAKLRLRRLSVRRFTTSPSTSLLQQSSSSSILEPQTSASTLPQLAEGSEVAIGGWIISIRKVSKTLAFAVLLLPRGQGKLQLIAQNEKGMINLETWEQAGLHAAVFVKGKLFSRPKKGQPRKKEDSNPLSYLELHVATTQILNSVPAGSLPFDPLDPFTPTKEEVRMKHRYLDLRGDKLGQNIRLRSKVSWAIRRYLHELDFTEVETPILLRSTPEGAREYLVPTRVNQQRSSPQQEGEESTASTSLTAEPRFFALQQSPQQPKQLLIASGVTDRYFQIAKCFRDEDGRKDRQAEFTQIDLEMGFLSGGDGAREADKEWRIGGQEIKRIIEGLIVAIWRAAGKMEEADQLGRRGFAIVKYDEAMSRFGSDKPDLRYGMELVELGQTLLSSARTGEEAIESGAGWEETQELELLCFTPPNGTMSNAEMDEIFNSNKEVLKGVERFKVAAEEPNVIAKLLIRRSANVKSLLKDKDVASKDIDVSSVVDKIQEAQSKGSLQLDGVVSGNTSFLFTASKILPASSGSTKLGDLRRLLMEAMIKKNAVQLSPKPHFVWITEFPLFTLTDSDKVELSKGRWSSSHHPFTSPTVKDIPLVKAALGDNSTATRSISANEKKKIMHTCKGQHYDLVLNGVEIGGGSIRIHDASLQRLILSNALQLTSSELHRFDHLLQALACGAPPHGGIALGFDRLMSILCETSTIRDVIAFPKSASSKDLLFQCPDALDTETSLQAYGLKPARL